MANITLSFPEELKQKMELFPEVNWSAFMRKYLESKINRLIWKEQMLKQLDVEKDFDEESIEVGNKIKEDVWKKLKKEGW